MSNLDEKILNKIGLDLSSQDKINFPHKDLCASLNLIHKEISSGGTNYRHEETLSAEELMLLDLARQDLEQMAGRSSFVEKKLCISAGNIVNYSKNIDFFVNFLSPYLISEDICQLLLSSFTSPAGLPYELEDENAILRNVFPKVARAISYCFQFSDDAIKEAFDRMLPELRKKYPLAKKSLDFSLQSKKQKKEFIGEIKSFFCDELLLHFKNEIKPEKDIETNVEIFITIINDVYHNIEELYSLLFQEFWKEKFCESHKSRETQQKKAQKLLVKQEDTSTEKELENDFDKTSSFSTVKINSQLRGLVQKGVDALTLSDGEKEKLTARLIRWTKNKLDLRISDYFGENPIIAIHPEDKDQFSSLIKSLGLNILEIDPKDELPSEKKSEQKIEESGESIEKTIDDVSALKSLLLLPELDDIDAVIKFSLQQLYECGYHIENEKRLGKQLKEFCIDNSHTSEIRNFFSDPIKLKTLEKKNKGDLYAIADSSQYGVLRLLLIKNASGYKVDSFFSNHDEYEKRIDYLAG